MADERGDQYEAVPPDLPEAMDAALRYLGACARSSWEVRRHLADRGFGDEATAAALARLAELRILDDLSFAQGFVETALLRRHEAPAKVEAALAARGVPREVVVRALAELDFDDGGFDHALALGASKLRSLHGRPLSVRRRLAAYLARRGYDQETCEEVCLRLLGDAEADQTDQRVGGSGSWGASVR